MHDIGYPIATDPPFLLQLLEHGGAKQFLQWLQIEPRHHLKKAAFEEQPVRHQQVRTRMPFAVVAKSLDRHHGPQDAAWHPERSAEEAHQAVAGAAAQFAQQLAVVLEMAAQNDGDAEDVMAMRNGVE